MDTKTYVSIESLTGTNMERLESFLCSIPHITEDVLDGVFDLVAGTDFLYAPASTRYHGARPGGLFDHSLKVAELLVQWTNKGLINWSRPCSPALVGLLHDWTKVGKYSIEPYGDPDAGPSYHYVDPSNREDFGGHGLDSCIKLLQRIYLTDEEVTCIRWHMGAYETDTWKLFDAAIHQHPSVLWTHHADMVASKIVGV